MKIVLLGAPGAGKGSQAAYLKNEYKIPHISTGDAFRKNIADATEIGIYAKSFIEKGQLVPDEVTVKIVESRLLDDDCKNGYLLDGFPRNLAQAEELQKFSAPDFVIDIEVPREAILKRLTGRLSCKCGATYAQKTYRSDVCEKCGQTLYVRDDDKEETILKRLDTYQSQTAPLIEYYREKGVLLEIDGNQSVEKTFEEIVRKVNDAR